MRESRIMEEIHRLRAQHSLKTRGQSSKRAMNEVERRAMRYLKKQGLQLPTPSRTHA